MATSLLSITLELAKVSGIELHPIKCDTCKGWTGFVSTEWTTAYLDEDEDTWHCRKCAEDIFEEERLYRERALRWRT